MWARIMGNQLVEVISQPKSVTVNGVVHPKEIFGSSWTDDERKAIGVVPYVYEGSYVQNMFYTSSESAPEVEGTRVVVKRTQSARDISKIKATMKASVSQMLANYLQQTDWIVIREQDNGTAKPSDLAKWRTDLRAKAAALETAIDNKSDVAALEAMTVFTEEMQDAGKKASEFHDWPENPRESGE
jgi:hypothetical protein|tara:strand:- start:304 stop:861 length:558 start_codon:yes stop_codon:yes gene_type:complete